MLATDGLVDRDGELAETAALIECARDGDGGALLFQGAAGIGKTAILEAGATLAVAADMCVLRGHGGEVERELSFGLVRELFEPVLRAAPSSDRRRWLSGAASAASAVFGGQRDDPADASSVAYGLYWLLAALAEEQPVMLVADDLHWCDPSSLRWLRYLARRIEGLPVGILAASRPFEPDDSDLVEQLAATEGVRVRRPEPLSIDATLVLLARGSSAAPDVGFARACHAATGGNPLLLRELLETARCEGLTLDADSIPNIHALADDSLRNAVLGRLGRLDPDGARLARAVAVLGDGCELRHASQLAGIDRDRAVVALPALIAVGVLADRQPLAFEHPLLRTAVYLDIPAPVRASEHGRAAALLSSTDAAPETVAHHLLASEPVGEAWAIAALREAARIARARGVPESAAMYLRRALDEGPERHVRAELVRSLGNALVRQGDPEGLAVLEDALALAASPAARVQIVDASIDTLLGRGRAAEARSLLLGALADVAGSDPEMALFLSARLAMVHALEGAPGDDPVAALRALDGCLDASTTERRYAAGVLAFLGAMYDGTATGVIELADLAIASEAIVNADALAGRPHYLRRVALALAGRPELALCGFERTLEIARASGSLMGQGIGLSWRALVHVLAGNVVDAENDGRAALEILADTGLSDLINGATAATAWALIERGELEEAQALLDASPAPSGWSGASLRCVRAKALIARHQHAEALDELAAVEQQTTIAGWRTAGLATWRTLAALAQLGVGEHALARQCADENLVEAARFGSAVELGRALVVRGIVEGGADGTRTLHDAVDWLRNADARLDLARALVEHGAALRRSGERASSRAPLHEGMGLAYESGASVLVERARTELRAAGARPRSAARSGVASLTPSERRVAALAAEGLANAEIAQTLFVTVRTVEMHLSAAYRKLEIASRGALPTALR